MGGVWQDVRIEANDTFSIDAFGRWRTSEPVTIFDSKNIFDDFDLASNLENQPLFFDNVELSGTGTSTTYNSNQASQTIAVSANTAGVRVRQTKMRFNYQPGKSMMAFLTFNLLGQQAGITKREGLFDDKNGLFLELDGENTVNFVTRTYTSGSAVDNKVSRNNWNVDKMDGNGVSGISIDFTKTQILVMDYEWLGVGRCRIGFVVSGKIYYAHYFNNANNLNVVYMSTPNLPIRSEIRNNGTGVDSEMTQICSTVISEGGVQNLGQLRYKSTAGTHIVCASENTLYALIGIRQKPNYFDSSINIQSIALQIQSSSHRCEWVLLLNPTVANSFTYTDESRSAIQTALGTTVNTVTGGYSITGGYVESSGNAGGAAGSTDRGIENAIRLGSTISGVADQIVLCCRPIGGSTNVFIEACMTWRELL